MERKINIKIEQAAKPMSPIDGYVQ